MQVYQGFPAEDLLLLHWWDQMQRAGELVPTLGERHERLAEFFAAFQVPARLLYETDGNAIAVACWYDPSPLSAAYFSCWVAPHWRGTRKGLRAIVAALGVGFVEYRLPAVLLVTSDPKIRKLHRHMGAEVCGEIPDVFAGGTAYLAYFRAAKYPALQARYGVAEAA